MILHLKSCDQSAQYRRDSGDWRECREEPPRWEHMAGSVRVPQSGGEVDVVLFLSSLTHWRLKKKENPDSSPRCTAKGFEVKAVIPVRGILVKYK